MLYDTFLVTSVDLIQEEHDDKLEKYQKGLKSRFQLDLE